MIKEQDEQRTDGGPGAADSSDKSAAADCCSRKGLLEGWNMSTLTHMHIFSSAIPANPHT